MPSSLAASHAPCTAARGAKSPPMASTATRSGRVDAGAVVTGGRPLAPAPVSVPFGPATAQAAGRGDSGVAAARAARSLPATGAEAVPAALGLEPVAPLARALGRPTERHLLSRQLAAAEEILDTILLDRPRRRSEGRLRAMSACW